MLEDGVGVQATQKRRVGTRTPCSDGSCTTQSRLETGLSIWTQDLYCKGSLEDGLSSSLVIRVVKALLWSLSAASITGSRALIV